MKNKYDMTAQKLDPEFRNLLLQLTLEYLTKAPEDFVEFSIDFLKKKIKQRMRQRDSSEDTTADHSSTLSEYDDDEGHGHLRQTIFQESVDPNEELTATVLFKTEEQKKNIKMELKKILVFKLLPHDDLLYLVDLMGRKEVTSEEVVIQQDDEGDYFYVVESGTYTAFKVKGDEKIILNTYDNKGYFGELALLYNVPRSCTVQAKTKGILWTLDRATFRHFMVKSAAERREQYVNFIRKVPMLSGLSESEQLDLADCLEPRVFPKDSRIIKAGDSADGMYFLLKGTAKVMVKQASSMAEVEVKRINAGEYFGELALVTHKPRAASVYAVSEVQTAFLNIESFERLLGPCLSIMSRNIDVYKQQMTQILGAPPSDSK